MYQALTDRLQTWHQPAPKLVSPKKTVLFNKSQHSRKPQDTSVSFLCLTDLAQTCPIFSAINIDTKTVSPDLLFYEKTIPLPAFVTTGTNFHAMFFGTPDWLYTPCTHSLELHLMDYCTMNRTQWLCKRSAFLIQHGKV